MIAVLSDTHGRDEARLEGAAREAVSAADVVIHAGDFTTTAVLDAFDDASDRLVAVSGNVDEAAVCARLPTREVLDVSGWRIAVVHGDEHGETARAMLGREVGADLVVSGHSHRAEVTALDDVTLLNPGSHADPRGGRPTHAVLEADGDGCRGRIVDRDGGTVAEFAI